jgi:hypothetical protein
MGCRRRRAGSLTALQQVKFDTPDRLCQRLVVRGGMLGSLGRFAEQFLISSGLALSGQRSVAPGSAEPRVREAEGFPG